LARGFASRAIDLDPGLAEGYLALGDVRRMLAWDWRGAEGAYTRAISLNPSAENAHRRYSLMLAVQSRREDSIREAERACELDPLCLVVRVSAALVHYFAGDYDAAIERCRHIIELGPQYLPARRLVGAAYLQAGRTADALQALESALTDVPDAPIALSWLAHAKAVTGDRAGAARVLERWRALDRVPYLPPFHFALAHLGLEDADAAFAALEQARADNDPALAYLIVDPRFAPLRRDPRFAQLTAAIGL
jgi:tetratricopeptide (TPR) repeat protein